MSKDLHSTDPVSITELEETARVVFHGGGYELREWSNGTYFLEAPTGEGTEVPKEAIIAALADLFRRFF